MITPWTVAQLREALINMPNDAPVYVQSYVPYEGDHTKRGGKLVHVDGLSSEDGHVEVLLWSAENS